MVGQQALQVLNVVTLQRALIEVDRAGGHHGEVPLSELRAVLKRWGFSRAAVDHALLEGERMGVLRLERGPRKAAWLASDPLAGLPTPKGLCFVARRM